MVELGSLTIICKISLVDCGDWQQDFIGSLRRLTLTCEISLVDSLLAFCFSSSWIMATQYSWFSFRFLVSRQLILRGFFLHFWWQICPPSLSVSVSSSESLPVLSIWSVSDWPKIHTSVHEMKFYRHMGFLQALLLPPASMTPSH